MDEAQQIAITNPTTALDALVAHIMLATAEVVANSVEPPHNIKQQMPAGAVALDLFHCLLVSSCAHKQRAAYGRESGILPSFLLLSSSLSPSS